MSAAVDVHNRYQTGSIGLGDTVRTKAALSDNSVVLWVFLTTNASLTTTNLFNFESPIKPGHPKFKTELSSRLMKIGACKTRITRCLEPKMMLMMGLLDHMSWKSSLGCETTSTAIIADKQFRTANQAKEHGFLENGGLHTLWALQRPEEFVLRCGRCMEFLKRDISVLCLK